MVRNAIVTLVSLFALLSAGVAMSQDKAAQGKQGDCFFGQPCLVGKKFTRTDCGLQRDRGYRGEVIEDKGGDSVTIKVLEPICCVNFSGPRTHECTAQRDCNALKAGDTMSISRNCVK